MTQVFQNCMSTYLLKPFLKSFRNSKKKTEFLETFRGRHVETLLLYDVAFSKSKINPTKNLNTGSQTPFKQKQLPQIIVTSNE